MKTLSTRSEVKAMTQLLTKTSEQRIVLGRE